MALGFHESIFQRAIHQLLQEDQHNSRPEIRELDPEELEEHDNKDHHTPLVEEPGEPMSVFDHADHNPVASCSDAAHCFKIHQTSPVV